MAQAKSPPPPPPKLPVITPEEGIVLLEELIERGKALRAPTSGQLSAYRAAVSTALGACRRIISGEESGSRRL
jgi:hypothetical protein